MTESNNPKSLPQADSLICLVEGEVGQAERLCRELQGQGYQVCAFADVDQLRKYLTRADAQRPQAVILALESTDSEKAARSLAVLGLGGVGGIPLLVLSERDELTLRLAAHRMGATRYLRKPVGAGQLLPVLDQLTGRQVQQPYRVLMVDDDAVVLELHTAILHSAGMQVRALSEPMQLLQVCDEFKPDVLLLDVYMPEADGVELAAVLRERYLQQGLDLPTLFLSGETDAALQLQALQLGGDDFLVKPVDPTHLVVAVTVRARRARMNNDVSLRRQYRLGQRDREYQVLDQHAIVSVADAQGRIVSVNDKFCEISGYSRAELLGRNHRVVKSGLHSSTFYEQMWATISSGQVWHGEVCNRRKDGRLYWVEATIAPILDGRGLPRQYVSVRTDITRIKEAEVAARESAARLNQRELELIEAQALAHIGNWSADMASGELHWSDEIFRIFGYEPGRFPPSVEAFKQAVHPDDRDLVQASETRAAQTGRHDVVHRIIRPDGTIRHVHELAQAQSDASGRLLRLTGTVQDVTERVQAEQRLRASQERFAFAVESAGDGLWDWDIPSGAMALSAGYETMLGYARGELEPTIDDWERLVHPDDLPRVRAALRDYLDGRAAGYTPELRMRCKDGSYKWVLCRGTVEARDAAGRPVRMIGIHSDISQRKNAEGALRLAREAAELASQAKSEFLSQMSHELRTPLNAILGFSQLLGDEDRLSEDGRDNVGEILKAGHHLLGLVNEVLDLAKVESGRMSLSLEAVELQPLVRECLSLVTTQAGQHAIALDVQGVGDLLVRADRMRLKQVLLNLLTNAIKYNRPQGWVRLLTQAAGPNAVRIQVDDSGLGIAADRIGELFEPFHRLDAEFSGVEGHGIGLALSRKLVQLMGGAMGVRSEHGVGSSFWFDLPLAPASLVQAESAMLAALPVQAEHSDGTVRHEVLQIEDNPANVRLMTLFLDRFPGIRLRSASTPSEGMELARVRRPDLILLDIHLPEMDGYAVLARLRADPVLRSVPVVAVTASAMSHDIERGRKAGFDAYLIKPLEMKDVQAVLERFLHTEASR